ncbi:MAG: GNAT family N-acetyltransferase, partial [Anaerolineae bacterium]
GEYPAGLEAYRVTPAGLELFLRPVKISDEPLLKEFFHHFSDESLYRRFMSILKSVPHERLQQFAVVDYTRDMVILATLKNGEAIEEVVGIGQYSINPTAHTADVALAVRDDVQGQGVGTALLAHLTLLAKKRGLLGFTADVLLENRRMLRLFEKMEFDVTRRIEAGVYELTMMFQRRSKRLTQT